MRAHLQGLLAGFGVDGPHGVVRATEGYERAFRVPREAVDGIERDGRRDFEFAFRHVPDLDFAEATRITTRDGEQRPVGVEGERLDPFAEADEPGLQFQIVDAVEQDFVIARHGEQFALGLESQRRDDRRGQVGRGMLGIDGQFLGRGGGIIQCPLLHPIFDRGVLERGQRRTVLRHFRLAVFVHVDFGQQIARLRFAGGDAGLPAVAGF